VTPAEAIAAAIGDEWWRICETAQTWATSTPAQKRTFATMADHALTAGRQGRRSVEHLAEALCEGFGQGVAAEGGESRPWRLLGENQRQVFRLVAHRVLATAQALRAARAAVSA